MKKIIIAVLVVGFILGMVLVPLFQGSNNDGPTDPLRFSFQENLAPRFGEQVPIDFEVNTPLTSVQLIYNDSVFQTWNNLEGKQTFDLNASVYGLGTRSLVLEGIDSDGDKYIDRRLLRVVSDIQPERWGINILKKYPHNTTHFTQGLEFHNGQLFQGTGDPQHTGQTLVGTLDLKTGDYTKKIGLDATYFGEGITVFDNQLYQLTYQKGKCFVYDAASLTLNKEFDYNGEGWGLTHDDDFLYMSNGTERIYIRDPKTFELITTLEVSDGRGPIKNLNELEYVDGLLYAHVWMTDAIVVIEPKYGRVLAVIDASELTLLGRKTGDVQNGIAYNPETNTFFITGKYWDTLFEVEFTKPTNEPV